MCAAEEQFKTRLRKFFTITDGTECYQLTGKQDKRKTGAVWLQFAGKKLLGDLEYLGKFLFN